MRFQCQEQLNFHLWEEKKNIVKSPKRAILRIKQVVSSFLHSLLWLCEMLKFAKCFHLIFFSIIYANVVQRFQSLHVLFFFRFFFLCFLSIFLFVFCRWQPNVIFAKHLKKTIRKPIRTNECMSSFAMGAWTKNSLTWTNSEQTDSNWFHF